MKNLVGRRRPSMEAALQEGEPPDPERFGPSSRESFYSDAAAKAFTYMSCTDSVLARRLEGSRTPRLLSGAGLYGLACYVAWTRIEQGRHYLSDVVVGAGAGIVTGKAVYRAHDRKGRDAESAFRVQPLVVPGGAGLMLPVSR